MAGGGTKKLKELAMNAMVTDVRAGDSSLTPKKGYKWIAKEIERLDVEKDYARIWALSTLYYLDDKIMNLNYTAGIPRLIQNPDGAEILRRSRKIIIRDQQRADDTISHFWLWWENGPNHVDTIRAVEEVNRIHEGMYKKVLPEAFSKRDFCYAPCLLGVGPHRAAKFVGLRGWSDKQKKAAHLFWKNVMAKMRDPRDGKYIIDEFPESFEAMEKFVDDFDNESWPKSEAAQEVLPHVFRQFLERNMPKPMWGFGRQMILTFTDKRARDLHDMGDPHPVAEFLIKKMVALQIWMAENVLPDPKLSTPERARAKGQATGPHQTPRMVAASACPYLREHGLVQSSGENAA